jgi:hypothetical protein
MLRIFEKILKGSESGSEKNHSESATLVLSCLITTKNYNHKFFGGRLNVRKAASFRPKGVYENAGTIHILFRGRLGGLEKRSGRRFTQHLGGIFQIKMCQLKRKKGLSSNRDWSSLKL